MAETRLFQGLITDIGISKAIDTQTVEGWYITPYKFAIAETKGEFSTNRTTMNPTWYTGYFSDVVKSGTNKIQLTIALAGNESTVQRNISEIYVICKTPSGEDFLYAIIQPLTTMIFQPTVSEEMNFVLALTNTLGQDVYEIKYIDETKLNAYQLKTEKGEVSGYCPLGADGIVPDSFLPLKDNLPIGTVVPILCSSSYIPVGYVPCDGAEYSYTQFTSVYQDYLLTGLLPTCTYTEYQNSLDTYGSCAKFALDTANSKFKVPTIADGTTLQQAKSDSQLSKLVNASTIKYTTGNTSATTQPKTVSLRWFVILTHGLINATITDWSAWILELRKKADTTYVDTAINGAKSYTDTGLNTKVSKAGDTMTGNLTIQKSGANSVFISKRTDYDYTKKTAPSANTEVGALVFVDKNGKYSGYINHYQDTSNVMVTRIISRRSIDGTEKTSALSVCVDGNGTSYVTAPTPATGDNSTKVATTAFVQTTVKTGTYVKKYLAIGIGATSLSSYLPNDGKNYMVVLHGVIKHGGVQTCDVAVTTSLLASTKLVWLRTDGDASRSSSNSNITSIPIGTDRKITLSQVDTPNSQGFSLQGYYRI